MKPHHPIRRVAIIGAGPGGVATAKYLLAEKAFDTIDIFEQQDRFAGVWNHLSGKKHEDVAIPQTDPNQPLEKPVWQQHEAEKTSTGKAKATFISPMYDGLETNIPHVLMKFSDDPSLTSHQLFPMRETVVEYLEAYSNEIRSLVQFQTQVTAVNLYEKGGQDSWSVQTTNIVSGASETHEYDAVVAANGHFRVPNLPDIKGIRDWDKDNPGVISHSKFYQNSKGYVNKKVLIVGSSASGFDIALKIAEVAKLPVLVSQRATSELAYAASYKEIVAQPTEFIPRSAAQRAVRFADGRVESDIEAVLFCTGYLYSFPFLSSLAPKLVDTGERVQRLYEHLFYIDHPTLAFIGVLTKILPFRTFESQAAVTARVFSGRLKLPSKEEMDRWEERAIADWGKGKAFHVLQFPRDINYHNHLVDWALQATDGGNGKSPSKWSDQERWVRERFPAIRRAFIDKGAQRVEVRTVEALGFNFEQWTKEQNDLEGVCQSLI